MQIARIFVATFCIPRPCIRAASFPAEIYFLQEKEVISRSTSGLHCNSSDITLGRGCISPRAASSRPPPLPPSLPPPHLHRVRLRRRCIPVYSSAVLAEISLRELRASFFCIWNGARERAGERAAGGGGGGGGGAEFNT